MKTIIIAILAGLLVCSAAWAQETTTTTTTEVPATTEVTTTEETTTTIPTTSTTTTTLPPWLHAYDADGTIEYVGPWSEAEETRLRGLGYTVVRGDEIERGDWKYQNGELVAYQAPDPDPAVLTAAAKVRARLKLEQAFQAYLTSRGYSPNWQALASEYRDKAEKAEKAAQKIIDNAESTQEEIDSAEVRLAYAQTASARLRELQDWITQTLFEVTMRSAYGQIQAAASVAEVDAVTCDFAVHDATDPVVGLSDEIALAVAVAEGRVEP